MTAGARRWLPDHEQPAPGLAQAVPGLAFPGLTWPGLAFPGLTWPGLAFPGLRFPRRGFPGLA